MSKVSKFLWLFMAILYIGLGLYFIVYYRETIKNKVAYKSQAYITLQANYSNLSGKYSDLNSSYEARIETLENTIETLRVNAELEKNEAIQALVADYEQQIEDIRADYEYQIRDLNNSAVDLARQLIQGGLTELEIPEGVTEIRDYAFKNMSSLVQVKLPNTILKIGQEAFYGTGITTFDIPSSVKYILDYCFAYSNLTSIYVPSTVLVFGEQCLYSCKKLTSLEFEASDSLLYGRLVDGQLASYRSGFGQSFYVVCERPVVNNNYGMSLGFWNVNSLLYNTAKNSFYYYDFVEGNNSFGDCPLAKTLSSYEIQWYAIMDDCINNTNAYSATDTLPTVGRYYARYVVVSGS